MSVLKCSAAGSTANSGTGPRTTARIARIAQGCLVRTSGIAPPVWQLFGVIVTDLRAGIRVDVE